MRGVRASRYLCRCIGNSRAWTVPRDRAGWREACRRSLRHSAVSPLRATSFVADAETSRERNASSGGVMPEERPALTGFPPIDAFNEAVWRSPIAAGGAMFGAEIASVLGCYGVIWAMGIPVSAEFALAFAVSRPIRKIRLPLEVLVAEGMARTVPVLTKARISRLMAALSPGNETKRLESRIAAGEVTFRLRDIVDFSGGVSAWMERTFAMTMFFMNRYGVCFQLASRVVGLVVVGLLYALISAGVDVQGFLEARGLGGLGTTAGQWSLAVVAASLVYPASLAASGYAALWIINSVTKA